MFSLNVHNNNEAYFREKVPHISKPLPFSAVSQTCLAGVKEIGGGTPKISPIKPRDELVDPAGAVEAFKSEFNYTVTLISIPEREKTMRQNYQLSHLLNCRYQKLIGQPTDWKLNQRHKSWEERLNPYLTSLRLACLEMV